MIIRIIAVLIFIAYECIIKSVSCSRFDDKWELFGLQKSALNRGSPSCKPPVRSKFHGKQVQCGCSSPVSTATQAFAVAALEYGTPCTGVRVTE